MSTELEGKCNALEGKCTALLIKVVAQTEEIRELRAKLADAFKWETPQVGGKHYESFKIQPITFIEMNELGYSEGNAIKYICRHAHVSNGIVSLLKAIDYIIKILRADYGYSVTVELPGPKDPPPKAS